ncbi:ATP-binding cassette domain-containing protein [Lachnoclostridium phytofermentans]|uniref:ABC transporter related n=1 Tax=Lachnoclostridium phytofermentans (strain ATCC 700394 / DSM 18823 / ISDg) TaxID=357809 RepID=A9KSV2_LACP7|nr:ATP-binding cassette domain-containing protein [Lachnoclostridium phytofermentans]ABX40746.1 ABC transporter related [Lachnoclostridium phytofermentans ISDg]
MNDILLRSSVLTKKYKNYAAVNQVNLTIKRGDIYGFIGRNGAGKTTFLKMISGLAKQTSGNIELFGADCNKQKELFSRIGVLIEAPGLFPNMTAFENLKMKCISHGIQDDNYIHEIIELIGLKDVNKKKTKNYSLGMKQRLGIGMALIGDPDLLVLDEPINGLDPQGIVEVRDTIQRLNKERNMTIIISSHILEELSKIATRYGIIDKGVLLQELTCEELMERCSERIQITLTGVKEACTILEEKLGIKDYKVINPSTIYVFEHLDNPALINMTLCNNGVLVSSFHVANDDLETYFINLTGGVSHA